MGSVIPYLKDDVEAMLRQRHVRPLAPSEQSVPDEWLALLEHLNGQATQSDEPRQIDRS